MNTDIIFIHGGALPLMWTLLKIAHAKNAKTQRLVLSKAEGEKLGELCAFA
jgi:hypothetical protein